MPSDTVERILTSAEKQARIGGYNGFSFREIAKEIGIKSASIHYHFPTKADLATELTRRYTKHFESLLGEIKTNNQTLHSKLQAYANLFYEAATTKGNMCLCGLFTAEIDILPDTVSSELKAFFQSHQKWLTEQLIEHNAPIPEGQTPQKMALQIIANMEGAMLLTKAFNSQSCFNDAIDLSAFASI